MQGGQQGERPATGVETQAEKNKFDREVLRHLIPRARMQQNHHRPVQVIDFSAFADSWNQDTVAAEKDVLAGLQERGLAGDLIYRKTAGHLQNYWTESRKEVNIKRTMEPHNAVIRTLRQRLTVQSATREAAQEDGDDRPASFGMSQSGQTIIFPSVATAQTVQAGPAPCAFARGMHGAEAEKAGRPGIDSCCCCCCFLTLTDPLRIQPWSQDRRNQTKSNRESEMSMESRQKRTDKK